MTRRIDPACLPETQPRQPLPPGIKPVSGVRHFALLYRDVVEGRFSANGEVSLPPCDWLRIESQYPIIVTADGERILQDVDQGPIPKAVPGAGPATFEFQAIAGASGIDFMACRPACSFTIHRNVRSLGFAIPAGGAAGDWTTFGPALVGTIHVFVGSGSVRDVTYGLPVPFVISESGGSGASFRIEPIRPTIYGNNAQSPVSTFRWTPSRAVITSLGIKTTWLGATGEYLGVTLNLISPGPAVNWPLLGSWFQSMPQVPLAPTMTSFEWEFSPIEIFPWQHREAEPGVGNLGALSVSLVASAAVDSAEIVFRGTAWF